MTTEKALAIPKQASQMVPVQDIERMAGAIVKSGLFGLKTPDQAVALMLVAQAQGRHPASVAMEYDVIQGRPALKSQAALARFNMAGGVVQYIERNDQKVSAKFTAASGSTVTVCWDMARARAMQLDTKDNWKKQPMIMLQWRCVAEGIRAVAPEVLGGTYLVEEVQDFAPLQAHTPPTAALTDKYAKPQEALPALPEPEPAPLPTPEPSDEPGPSQVVSGPCEDGYIQEVKEKSGKTGTKAWVRFGILVNDQWHNTFDSKLADACKSLKADGLRGILSYEVNAKGFRDIKSVHASTNTAPPSDPTEGMEEGIP